MKKSNKIVRIRRIDNTNESPDRWNYYIYLTTFREFLSETNFKCYGQIIELYPYRWYEIEKLWEIPIYYILSFSTDGRQRSTILANKNPAIKAIIRVVIWIVSGIAMFILTEYLLRPFLKTYFHIV